MFLQTSDESTRVEVCRAYANRVVTGVRREDAVDAELFPRGRVREEWTAWLRRHERDSFRPDHSAPLRLLTTRDANYQVGPQMPTSIGDVLAELTTCRRVLKTAAGDLWTKNSRKIPLLKRELCCVYARVAESSTGEAAQAPTPGRVLVVDGGLTVQASRLIYKRQVSRNPHFGC